ncbi:hypothetical protein ACFXA3_18235 [Streptomyces sp. NPDC059456]|uniref:hypothetical protein n=1 Tax=Streptomyces sp. NPDC059456 TaxID=3346838 RepID=UPI0036A5545D
MVKVLLGEDPLRLPEAERERLFTLARHWYQRGVEAILRDRTAEFGPVRDEVRAGHGAVLTQLECAFGILTPVDELVDRATAHGGRNHADREFAVSALTLRRDADTFQAVTAHRQIRNRYDGASSSPSSTPTG